MVKRNCTSFSLGEGIRTIDKIILHCTDSDVDHDINEIARWHRMRGFKDVGYHFLIRRHGIQFGRPIDQIGAHCKGQNSNSLGICLTGKNEFDQAQFEMTARLISSFFPGLAIYPHNYFNKNKRCPGFDIEEVTSLLAV